MRSKVFASVVILVCISFLAAGCTTDPYTGKRKASNTSIGAGVGAFGGAAAGVAVGALTGKTKSKELRKRALIGAGVGALVGGSVGAYMDYQEAKLRKRLQKSGVSVTREGDRIILNMPGNISFDTGSADIKSNFYEVLNSVAIVLEKYDKTYVDVYGHTDSTGSKIYNQKLSEQRAQSVYTYLVSQGLNSDRFSLQGFGETRPIAPNTTGEGRTQNRRVEIEIAPIV
jgi:outer membrane protein OmpA-like peptidoglycan-associated protein